MLSHPSALGFGGVLEDAEDHELRRPLPAAMPISQINLPLRMSSCDMTVSLQVMKKACSSVRAVERAEPPFARAGKGGSCRSPGPKAADRSVRYNPLRSFINRPLKKYGTSAGTETYFQSASEVSVRAPQTRIPRQGSGGSR